MKKIYLVVCLIATLVLTGASCISFKGSSETSGRGGVFKSTDKGDSWTQKVAVPSVKGGLTIGNVDVSTMTFDPHDSDAMYLGTTNNGLLYTLDGGEAWRKVKSLSGGRINAVAVDSLDKCNIYVASGNKILKSEDCTRTWENTYVDPRVEGIVTTLDIDLKNPNILFAGLATGDLIKSTDGGSSWFVAQRFNSGEVVEILIDTNDSNLVYVGNSKMGVWKSIDSGKTWIDLYEKLKPFKGSQRLRSLVLVPSEENTLLMDSKYGMLKTADGGETWTDVNLLTPSGEVDIYSLAVNPRNGNEIYYGTSSTIYKSVDGGASWVTKKMPTPRAANFLAVHPEDGDTIYLGTLSIKK